ncbi:MAG: pantetheine-phosphate adenylyltransferase [Actinobacteria bacterium]|nr:pantetheine-phosphate adenylyltransferase [Actinomycetota bacterium]MCL6087051.1 pantetheine-phosphate adenylyltransferase [Actinomycetota bacterium]
MGKIALCPGTYDPVTEGHRDIIRRCCSVFDTVIVAVSENPKKEPLYSLKKRIEFLSKSLTDFKNIEIITFKGLLIDTARKKNAMVIVKGLRAISDFEYELQMAQMNKKLAPEIETFFLVSNPKYAYLSSSAVKEVAGFGGCIKGLIPEEIENDMINSFKNNIFK